MPVSMLDPELRREPRPASSRFAILGAIRALESAYPLLRGEVLTDRQSKALAALMQAETDAALHVISKTTSLSMGDPRPGFRHMALHVSSGPADWPHDTFRDGSRGDCHPE
jgi:hypothetical protein